MKIPAMTSITFQALSQKRVVDLAIEAELLAIEWCENPHIPCGDIESAKNAHRLTSQAGLEVLSYSTYFKPGNCKDAEAEFLPFLNTAKALQAKKIRIWAGDVSSKDASKDYIKKMAREAKIAADMAKEHDITLCFEYHRQTLSDNPFTIQALLKDIGRDNVKSYWQPNPELSLQENLSELKEMKDYLQLIHVFYWNKYNHRQSLKDGKKDWLEYISLIDSFNLSEIPYILEFTKNDEPSQFLEDAKVLLDILREKK